MAAGASKCQVLHSDENIKSRWVGTVIKQEVILSIFKPNDLHTTPEIQWLLT